MRNTYALRVQRPTLEDSSAGVLARRISETAPGRDRGAEERLYRNLAPRARLYGLKYLRDSQAAADLAQEVMLMTLQRLQRGEIREPERIASFVLGACRQMVSDWQRGKRRRERILGAYAAEFPIWEEAGPLPFDGERLRRCVEGLSERERAVVLMTFYDERSAQQIAVELGTSAANIRVLRHRGIQRLRDCLDRTGHFS